jgi:hypothetical protein
VTTKTTGKTKVTVILPQQTVALRCELAKRRLIFTHIPKAAGSTLDQILLHTARATGHDRIRALGTIYGQFLGFGKLEAIDSLKDRLSRWKKHKPIPRVLSGHLPFGIHEVLGGDACYVTMVREPVARALSHFRFGIERGGWTDDADIDELYDSGRIALNLQTRQLAGLGGDQGWDRSTLAIAQRNLSQFYGLVGRADQFETFVSVLLGMLGWPGVAAIHMKESAIVLPPERAKHLAERIRERDWLDAELYDWVCAEERRWVASEATPVTVDPERARVLVSRKILTTGSWTGVAWREPKGTGIVSLRRLKRIGGRLRRRGVFLR